ncbi:MAG: hypothetical protein ABI379_09475 [Rhodanobacter sp.]
MKFEALILRVLCAGSMLVCLLALGNMVLVQPALVPAIAKLACTTQCSIATSGLSHQRGVAQPQRS